MVNSSDFYFWAMFGRFWPLKLHKYCGEAAAEQQDANHRAGQALAELLVRTLRLQGKYGLLGGRAYYNYSVLSKKGPQTTRMFFSSHIHMRFPLHSHVPCCFFSLNAGG